MSIQIDVLSHWGRAYHSIPDLDLDLSTEALRQTGEIVQDVYPEILVWPEVLAAEAYLYFLSEYLGITPEQAFLKTVRRCQEFILFLQDRMKKNEAKNVFKQSYAEALN